MRLERTFDGHADVVGLGLGQLSHNTAETADHFQGHFFVEFLRQYFNGQALGFLGWRQGPNRKICARTWLANEPSMMRLG